MDIRNKDIEKLLQIIPNYPKINIFHINDISASFSKKLNEFASSKEYEYDDFYLFNPIIKTKKLDINQPRYNRHAKLYDFIFISSDLEKIEDKKLFFKKIYHICKNGAKIMIFLKQKDYELESILEDLNFVASNYIDISSDYEVLSVQKMHGWGVYDM